MGSWWNRRRSADSRIRISALAIIGWIVLLAILLAIKIEGHPLGNNWFFIIAAPFYFAFFVQQIRRARAASKT